MSPTALLVLRAEPGASATVRRALSLGLAARPYPLFAVEPLVWAAPDPADFDALMLTSAHTLREAGPQLERFRHLPAGCVGEATARAARAAGLTPLTSPGGTAQALVESLARAGHRRLFHPGGADRRPYALPEGLSVRTAAVYRAAEAGDAAGLAAHLDDAPLLLVHSPRAGARLAALVPPHRRPGLALLALSPAAREAAGPGWKRAEAAATPTDAAMLALARQICHSPPPTP